MKDAFRKFATKVSEVVGSFYAFILAILLIIGWLLTGPVFHFSDTWQLIINTTTTVITFLMVFIIQNTQNRETRILYLKIDELIRAQRSARNILIDLEKLSDEELDKFQGEFDKMMKKKEKL